jgi:hypothetical protein
MARSGKKSPYSSERGMVTEYFEKLPRKGSCHQGPSLLLLHVLLTFEVP